MIDLHSHILPGLDDGARTIDESLAMAQQAIDQGITHLMCTPHHLNGKFMNPADSVIEAVDKLQKELDQRHLPLTLLEGQEVRLTEVLLSEIGKESVLFIDVTDRYLLLELPTKELPLHIEGIFYQLIKRGYIPVIAHPERNLVFRKDPNRLLPFLKMGALTQLTAPSIVGVFGKEIQHASKQLLEHQMGFMVASDAHNVSSRAFLLKEAYEEIQKICGSETVTAMQKMAKDLVNGDPVDRPNYRAIKESSSISYS